MEGLPQWAVVLFNFLGWGLVWLLGARLWFRQNVLEPFVEKYWAFRSVLLNQYRCEGIEITGTVTSNDPRKVTNVYSTEYSTTIITRTLFDVTIEYTTPLSPTRKQQEVVVKKLPDPDTWSEERSQIVEGQQIALLILPDKPYGAMLKQEVDKALDEPGYGTIIFEVCMSIFVLMLALMISIIWGSLLEAVWGTILGWLVGMPVEAFIEYRSHKKWMEMLLVTTISASAVVDGLSPGADMEEGGIIDVDEKNEDTTEENTNQEESDSDELNDSQEVILGQTLIGFPPGSMGLTLGETRGPNGGFLVEVVKDTCPVKEQMFVGDEVIAIDQVKLTGKTHSQFVAALRERASKNKVLVVVRTKEEDEPYEYDDMDV